MKAQVIKIISNRYTVLFEDKHSEIALCAGKMRLKDKILVGDYVEVKKDDNTNIITDIYPRKNCLKRPFISNVDQALIVMSAKEPLFSYNLVNRLLMLVEYYDIKPLIVITKCDLLNDENIDEIKNYYQKMDYDCITFSKFASNSCLKQVLKGKISVLSGQSGVGKTSILNNLCPNLKLPTNEISKALNRGKHTTRHVELYSICDGYLVDTPGFSSIDLHDIDLNRFKNSISIFKKYQTCRFLDCNHMNEPDCGIKLAVLEGKINNDFYLTYLEIMKMIKNGNLNADNHRRLK